IIEEEGLNQRGEEIGKKVMERFQKFNDKFKCIGDIRGLGAMCAIEIVKDQETKEPAKELTNQIIKEANKRGLLIFSAGIYSNVIRLLMPLVITDEQLEEGLNILENSIEAAEVALNNITHV
ncbi:MAG: aminotransferase class III-fold pyridoxal phosphate-dependent enzyme, partial [Bacillota bacterium]|nr:aminotransferase class III-fold pyridoxal phosphate-dependent enzyme [Bacillota bacterium]